MRVHVMDEVERPFLRHFDSNERGWINNLFLDAVRKGGATNVPDALNWVSRTVHQKIDDSRFDTDQARVGKWRQVKFILAHHLDEADQLAGEAIAYLKLPAAERQAHKEAQAQAGRQRYMATQEPTGPQLSYLKTLGYEGPITDRAHASELIDKMTQRRT
jgi:hypothetical protein